MVNRFFITEPTNRILEKELECYLYHFSTCKEEEQRFIALATWSEYVPDLKWSGRSLSAYFDQIQKRSQSFRADFLIDDLGLSIEENKYMVEPFKDDPSKINIKGLSSNLLLLNSPLLRISSHVSTVKDLSKFSSFQIVMYLNNSVPVRSVYNITATRINQKKNDG